MKKDDLIKLAERVEAATAADRELFDAAFIAVHGPKPPRVHGGSTELGDWLAIYNRFYDLMKAEAWLDAALTLVPEGWRTGFEMGGRFDSRDVPNAWCWPWESDFEPDWQLGHEGYRSAPDGCRGFAATPALALCAASLRALATTGKEV
jgi:hypothetical protein